MKNTKNYSYLGVFTLESGQNLDSLNIAYQTYGTYIPGFSKVVWVCHALTANADVQDWWEGLFGKEKYFDQPDYFVVCANILASCYGTTGPLSQKKEGGNYYLDFPLTTTRDMAVAHESLRKHLGLPTIHLLIGASLGGQQAQEFAIILKNKLENLVLIATNAVHSPFGRAFNEAQRLSLQADPDFQNGSPEGGQKGLIAARSIAMLSYRSYLGYELTQAEKDNAVLDGFRASTYQQYQGEKLTKRFNAYSYWFLSKAMDAHNVGRNRYSIEAALQAIEANTLVIGISSDALFPVSEQQFLARYIPNASFHVIHSIFGHDGFLVETNQLERLLDDFLTNDFKGFKPTSLKSLKHINEHEK